MSRPEKNISFTVDIDLKTLGISTEAILAAITPRTRAVFITHVLGLNALTTKLLTELKKKNVMLIEDVCESHGAKFKNKKVGTYGLISNFSFYYAHHMTTIEGGMLSTNSKEIYDMARSMRSHGLLREIEDLKVRKQISKKYPDLNSEFIFLYPAHNMRPTEIGGILGLSQLKRLSKNIQKRNNNFEFFLSLLDSSKYRTDLDLRGHSNYALIVILKKSNLELRNKVETILFKKGIEFRRGLSGGGNQLRQPYLQKIAKNYNLNGFPNIEHIHNYSWYIGNYPKLEKKKIMEEKKIIKKQLLEQKNVPFICYSKMAGKPGKERWFLVDAMGILFSLYQIAHIAIVGGSFLPHLRGHNIFEPIQAGAPVLFGPYKIGRAHV